MFLHMPTMEFNKGDQEDSDYEETVEVAQRKVECVIYQRKLLDIDGDKVPVTIQLMGYNNDTYLDINMTAYNPANLKEQGIFFTVN